MKTPTLTPQIGRLSLQHSDYSLSPTDFWKSPRARYPIAWKLSIPSLQIEATISTPLPSQELPLDPVAYWEGMIEVTGQRANLPLKGRGYMELTGYAAPLAPLRQTPSK